MKKHLNVYEVCTDYVSERRYFIVAPNLTEAACWVAADKGVNRKAVSGIHDSKATLIWSPYLNVEDEDEEE